MTTHEFCLFVDGADLTVASTVERLECAGYTQPAAAASAGVQALAFSRQASCLADAVADAVAAAEHIPGTHVAREARSGAVAVFDLCSLKFTALHDVAPSADAADAPRKRTSRGADGSQHRSSAAIVS